MSELSVSEVEEFCASLKKFLATEVTSEIIRSYDPLADKKPDVEKLSGIWHGLTGMGIFSSVISESYGGLSLGMRAAVKILEVVGSSLCPLPFSQTMIFCLPFIFETQEQELPQILQEILSGKAKCSAALTSISGNGLLLPFASESDYFLLFDKSASSGNPGIYFIDTSSKSLKKSRLSALDISRPYYLVNLSKSTKRELLTKMPENFSSYVKLIFSSELLGICSHALNLTKDYVGERKQFGRTLGSFQAVKHKLADCYMRVEQIRALVEFSANAADTKHFQFNSASNSLSAFCTYWAPQIIENCIQLHGGIGFSYEYDLHLYLRRAKMLALELGVSERQFMSVGKSAMHA